MIDNFNQIKTLCPFYSDDDFYVVQILKRRRENPEMKKAQKLIHTFYLYCQEDFSELRDKIINLCQEHNARAYIRMNRRSLMKIALHVQKIILDATIKGTVDSLKSVQKAYLKACGKYSNAGEDKKWIIDVDTKDETFMSKVKQHLISVLPENRKILAIIPTPNGYHIVVQPTNPNIFLFEDHIESEDVKKEANTILYSCAKLK